MGKKSTAVTLTELGGRTLAGALGWVLVLLGGLGATLTILRLVGTTAPTNYAASTVVLVVCALVVAVGLYGNPRIRERVYSALQ